MFEDPTLKLKLYFYPVMFFIAGSICLFVAWDVLGILFWVLGVVSMLHVLIVSIIRERTEHIRSQADYYTEFRGFYETIMRMSEEDKYTFGLSYVPKEVLVKKDKTADEGNDYSQTWKKLPVAPYKLKVIAQACLNGEGFTYRKWAEGGNKLLTDPEWRALHEAMVQLGMLEPVNPDEPRQGYSWTSFGMDVMTQVVKEML